MHIPMWSRIGKVFHAALEMPPEQRDAFLARECGADSALRDEVATMLRAHAGETRLAVEDRLLAEGDPAERLVGRAIGAYRLVGLLGRGGMGDVYLAERDDDQYERRVALKLLRPGVGGLAGQERFRRERQILAQLEHPNIATLLDGGVADDGRPYLVMKYVDGEPITEWCRSRNLPLRRRLELFRTVCDTVQAAHNSLVVHRDLKPANILVTADGQVRLLDFGIAKLLDEVEPGLTMAMDAVLTPDHAAPEQVTGRAVTAATDVYGLGVLLYEMLTDERPFAVDRSSAAAIERTICETRPAPPSTHLVPHRRAMRGELDNIVLMALRKEPERRYQSAHELGEEVDNYLRGRPVRAQGDAWTYRLRKFLIRRRWPVAVTAAFAVIVAIFIGAITRESRQRLIQRDRADAVIGVLSELLTEANPAVKSDADGLTRDNFIDMLDEAVGSLDDQPEVQARLWELLASVFSVHGRNNEWLATMDSLVAYHERHGSDPLTVARVRHNQALASQAVYGAEVSVPLLRESLERHRKLLGSQHRDVGVAATDLARNLAPEDPEAAADLMREALAIARANSDVDSLAVARVFNALGNLAMNRGDRDAAREHYETTLEMITPFLGETNPNTMMVNFNLAQTLYRPGELPRAESLLRRNRELREQVLGRYSTPVAYSWEALGSVLALQGRPQEALEALEEALNIQREVSGDQAPSTSYVLVKAASLLTVLGQADEAVDRFAEVRTMEAAQLEEGRSPDLPLQAFGLALEALARYEAGDQTGALALLDEATAVLENSIPASRAWISAEIATVQATLLLAEGHPEKALPAARRALSDQMIFQPEQSAMVGRNQALVAAALAATGRLDEAGALLVEFADMARECGYLTPLQRRLLLEAEAATGL